jgi:uncharacterized delta-60 repeat protein
MISFDSASFRRIEMKSILTTSGLLILTVLFIGCGGGGNPILPENNPPAWNGSAGVQSVEPGDESITVRFGTATDPDGDAVTYSLFYCDETITENKNPLVTPNNKIENITSPYQLTGLVNGHKYWFGVRAMDSEGLVDANTVAKSSQPSTGGNLMWAKKRTGGISSRSTILSDDSTVVTGVYGYFGASATFGAGEINETVLLSRDAAGVMFFRNNQFPPGADPNVHGDIFVARYNPDGSLAWAKQAGGANSAYHEDSGRGITSLSDNSTVVAGHFEGSSTFGSGEANETILSSVIRPITVARDIQAYYDPDYYYDIFIARYNPDGTLAWAKRAGGEGSDLGTNVKSLSDNSTVMTGYIGDTATFGAGEVHETILSGLGYFIARYNPDGTLAWAKKVEGSGHEITTLSDDSFVLTGVFSTSAEFGPGEANQTTLTTEGWTDVFIAKFNPVGTLVWAKRAGGATGETIDPYLTTLSDDSTVVTGIFEDSSTFGAGETNQTVLNCVGWRDVFIARYNTDGTLAWAKRAGGSGWDNGTGITTLSDNSIVVCGHHGDAITFGPGETNETILSKYETLNDGLCFIARYNQDGTLLWAKNTGGDGYGVTGLSDNTTVLFGSFYDTKIFGPGEINEIALNDGGDFMARFKP